MHAGIIFKMDLRGKK